MKLEQQVVSLELSKRLKELGVKQESLFWWEGEEIYSSLESCQDCMSTCSQPNSGVSAFTVAELGEMLNEEITCISFTSTFGEWIAAEYSSGCYYNDQEADTEADARAKLLIFYIEEGIITKTK